MAGPANLAASMTLVADYWRARGWDVVVRPTEAAGHATTLAREAAAAGHSLVLAAGGDGTLGDVTNGLANTRTVMAPLPLGTANSFARELNMPLPGLLNPRRLWQDVEVLADGMVQEMDLGYLSTGAGNGRYWLLWAGVGADGFLVDELEPRPKWTKRVGPISYVFQGVPVLLRLPSMNAVVDVDGETYQGDYLLVLVSNSRRYAGGMVELSPGAYLDDGVFEVWLLPGRGILRIASYLVRAKFGDLTQHENVRRLVGQRITIRTSPPFPFQTDGEPAGHTPFTVSLKPRALRLLVPSTAPANLFTCPGIPLADLK
ncbi:MAG: diacylglycerol kinase family lipid kinase [Ardenticatenaceae bacterium]|nr:diacylglycerol kinase family lipid kinase [Ardenticatenaceae bacterium]